MGDLRVIIPAHNEENRIERTLRDYCTHFADRALICVVLNGCTDRTYDVVARLLPEFANLKVVNIPAAIGKGGAVRAGFLLATEPYVGFVDADSSTSAEEFDRLYSRCVNRAADGVIASRWSHGAIVSPRQPWKRRLASRVFNQVARLLFRLRFNDTQCGAKIFRRAALEAVFDDLELANFAFDIDLLFQLRRSGARIVEEPTVWSDEAGTKVKLVSSSMSMLSALVRLRLLRSWLGGLPYLDFLARQSVIRVSRQLRLLVVDGGGPEGRISQQCCTAWRNAGCSVDVVSDGANPGNLLRIAKRVGFLMWYAFANRRMYDAVIEFSSNMPYVLPALSAKNVFVVGPRCSPLYALLYRRQTISFLDNSMTAADLAKEIATSASLNRLYVAQFLLGPDAWSLVYADAEGERREHVLA